VLFGLLYFEDNYDTDYDYGLNTVAFGLNAEGLNSGTFYYKEGVAYCT
jgi:hypothetical protein